MVSPSTLMLEDVYQIFFNHTNIGSHLRDLDCQRLAYDVHGNEDEEDNVPP